jgi:hypothetical protein
LLVTGCSSFGRDWHAAAARPVSAVSLAGRWEGTWQSAANGHRGRLRAVLTPAPANGTWNARFHATYAGFLTFGYTAELRTTNRSDGVYFGGEIDLGPLAGGVYRYAGRATATNFHCTYTASQDHGRFEMVRPAD